MVSFTSVCALWSVRSLAYWIHPHSPKCLVNSCSSVTSQEGVDSSLHHKSQDFVLSLFSEMCKWELTWEQKSLILIFGLGVRVAFLFLIFCLVTQKLLGFPVMFSPSCVYIIFFMSAGERKSPTDNERATRSFISQERPLENLCSWRVIPEKPHSKLNRSQASKVGKLGLSSLEGGRPQETRCLASYVIIHSISHLHLGTLVLPFPPACPV